MASNHNTRAVKPPPASSGLYFPPPPSSTLAVNDRSHMKKPRGFRSRYMSNGPTDQQHKSILKRLNTAKRHRQMFLLSLLALSFAILVLGIIFAYCAALPHSNHDAPPDADESTMQAAEQEKLRDAQFTSGRALARLSLYTAFLPLLSMAHASTELLVTFVRTSTFSRKTQDGPSLSRARRILPIFSFTACLMLLIGWIPLNIIYLNCEVVPFGEQNMCPIQIRGHHMAGLDQLAVAKDVMSWVLVGVYAGYLGWLVWGVRVFSGGKKGKNARRARFEGKELEVVREEHVVMEEGGLSRGGARRW